MAIKAIITDLGGVFVLQPQRANEPDWKDRSGITQRELFRIISRANLDQAATLGKISSEEVWQQAAVLTNVDVQAFHELEKRFFAAEHLNQELVDFFQSIHSKYRIAALSNAWNGVREALERKFTLSQYFDLVLFSCDVGLAKPDARIYQLILHRLNLYPEETIFLDNNIANVDAARVLGMQSVLYRTGEQAIADMRKILEK